MTDISQNVTFRDQFGPEFLFDEATQTITIRVDPAHMERDPATGNIKLTQAFIDSVTPAVVDALPSSGGDRLFSGGFDQDTEILTLELVDRQAPVQVGMQGVVTEKQLSESATVRIPDAFGNLRDVGVISI